MTTLITTSAAGSARAPKGVRVARIGLWALRVLLSGQFALAGVLKLIGDPSMVSMFEDIGTGQFLRLVIGASEVAAAAGLLIPRLAVPAASGLVLLMAGAAVTNALVLQTSPVVPLVLGLLAAAVAVALRKVNGR